MAPTRIQLLRLAALGVAALAVAGWWWPIRNPAPPNVCLRSDDRPPFPGDGMVWIRAGRSLPTEAQWEFAARGGLDGKTFAWGDEADHDGEPQANFWHGVFPVLNLGAKGYKGTSPVGCFPANGYGLYDMAGNVWQWTR